MAKARPLPMEFCGTSKSWLIPTLTNSNKGKVYKSRVNAKLNCVMHSPLNPDVKHPARAGTPVTKS